MKKLLTATGLGVVVAALILVTPPGQTKILLPVLNLYLNYKIPGHQVMLTNIEAGWNSLRAEGMVDGTIHIRAEGPVRWPGMHLDLGYEIEAEDVTVKSRRYPVQLALRGKARGIPDALEISGKGRGFDAELEYFFRVREGQVLGVSMQAKGAKIKQLLALAGHPPYLGGELGMSIRLPRLDLNSSGGSIVLSVENGEIDPDIFRKETGTILPETVNYSMKGNFRLENGLLKGELFTHTSMADLKLTGFRADPRKLICKSRYRLDISDLSRWRRLSGRKLEGSLQIGGEFYLNSLGSRVQVTGTTPSVGGNTAFFYDNGRMDLILKGADPARILGMFGEKKIVRKGRVDGNMRLESLKKHRGNFDLRIDGRWDRRILNSVMGADPGKDVLDFTFGAKGNILDGVIELTGRYTNDLMTLDLPKVRYEPAGGALEGRYRFRVADMGRWIPPKGMGFRGRLEMIGNVNYLPVKQSINVNGNTKSFGGSTRFSWSGKRLKLRLKNVRASMFMKAAGLPPLLVRPHMDAEIDFSDLDHRIGKFAINIKGETDRSILAKHYGLKASANIPCSLKSRGEIKGDILSAEAVLESPMGTLKANRYEYHFQSGRGEGSYLLSISDLSRLRPVTGKNWRGPFRLSGKIRHSGKTSSLTGGGENWGGRLDYALERSLLHAKAREIRMPQLLRALGYMPMLDGRAYSDLRYNLGSEKGTLKIEIRDARFVDSPLTRAVNLVLKSDFGREVFHKAVFTSQIAGESVIFDFHAASEKTILNINHGRINRNKMTINALMRIERGEKNYKIRIYGPLDRPGVTPLLTDTLQKKISHEIMKRKDGKKNGDNRAGPEKDSGTLENLIRNLF